MRPFLFLFLQLLLCIPGAAQNSMSNKSSPGLPDPSDTVSRLAMSLRRPVPIRNDTVLDIRQVDGRFLILQIDINRFNLRSDTFVYKPCSDGRIAVEKDMRNRLNRGVQFFILLFSAILLIIIWIYYVMTLEPVLRRQNPVIDRLPIAENRLHQ